MMKSMCEDKFCRDVLTYHTNHYGMPIRLLVSVNNHFQHAFNYYMCSCICRAGLQDEMSSIL